MFVEAALIGAVLVSLQDQPPVIELSEEGPSDADARELYQRLVRAIEGLDVPDHAVALANDFEQLAPLLVGPERCWLGELHWTLALRLGGLDASTADVAEHYRSARDLYHETGQTRRAANASFNYGAKLQELGRLEEALAEQEAALGFYAQVGDDASVAETRINLANTLKHLTRDGDALQQAKSATVYFRAAGHKPNLSRSLLAQAEVYLSTAQLAEAMAVQGELLAVARAAQLVDDEARAWQLLANVYIIVGRFEDALENYVTARECFEKADNTLFSAKADVGIGQCLTELGRLDEAEKHFRAALRVLRPDWYAADWCTAQFLYATLLAELGRIDQMHKVYEELRAANERLNDLTLEADILQNIGGLYVERGELVAARRELDKAARIRRVMGRRLPQAQIAEGRAEILAQENDHGAALEEYARAAAFLEDLQRTQLLSLGAESSHSIRSTFHSTLSGAMECLEQLPDAGERELGMVYAILQSFHGVAMSGIIADRAYGPTEESSPLNAERTTVLAKLRAAEARRAAAVNVEAAGLVRGGNDGVWERIDQGLAPVEAEIVALHAELLDIEERARAASHRAAFIRYPHAASIAEVQGVLDSGMALLEYAWTDEAVFAFAITTEGAVFEHLASRTEAQALVEKVRRAIPGKLDMAALREACDVFVAPLLGEGIERLVVAPDGPLCELPFEAFAQIREGRERYLIEEYDIAYLHSGTAAVQRAKLRTAAPEYSKRFAALGDPTTGHGENADRSGLLGTAIEAVFVAALVTAEQDHSALLDEKLGQLTQGSATLDVTLECEDTFVALGSHASEHVLKSSDAIGGAEIVHIGCHGIAASHPELSRLHLAAGKGEDGLLTPRELAALELKARLLVLSACESNVGPILTYEGATGFARAGLAAGADSVLSTLWRVRDEDAQRLISAFYRRVLGEDQTPTRALAEVKRKAIRRLVPLSSWSAYVLWTLPR